MVLVWIVTGVAALWGQSLQLRRSDGGDTNTVTAGERMRLALQVQGAVVYGAGCRIVYEPSSGLVFAGWTAADFQRAELFVVASDETQAGVVTIDVGAVSLSRALREPVVVVLEFVLRPDAPHGALVHIRAEQGWVLMADSLRLVPEAVASFTVHGYVAVWPGDANNDGVVNGGDVAAVGLYAYRRATGYRRHPASVEWQPQSALAWADQQATYADCDGNGAVTLQDLAVVLQNYGLSRGGALAVGEGSRAPQESGELLYRISLPAEADVAVGVFQLRGGRVTGLQCGARTGLVATVDSLTFFVVPVAGGRTLDVFGAGAVALVEVQYRTLTGQWQQLAGPVLSVSELPTGGSCVDAAGERLCVEGGRRVGGWIALYTLEGREYARYGVPPGEQPWCFTLSRGMPMPSVVVYRSAAGDVCRRLLLP